MSGDVLPETGGTPYAGRWVSSKVLLIAAVLAVPAGAAWWMLAPLPRLKIDPQGVLYVGSQSETEIAADAWFGITTAVAGLLCAVLAFRIAKGASPRVLIPLTLGGLLGSVLAWRVGLFLGPAPLDVQAKQLSLGDEFDGALVLSAFGMMLAWPLAAVTTYFSLVAGLESAPRAVLAPRAAERQEGYGELTPDDVAAKQFTSTRLRPGYDEAEVDDFLEHVFVELRRLHQDIHALRAGGATAARIASAARRRKNDSALTADEVAHKQFTTTRLRPGYDEAEVDQFLQHVVVELRRVQQDIDALRAQADGGTENSDAPAGSRRRASSPSTDDPPRQWQNRSAAAPTAAPSRGGSLRRILARVLGREEEHT